MFSHDEESRSSSPKKKKRTESSKRTCIIHIRSNVKGDVTGFKEKAWQVSVVPCFDSICKFWEFWCQSKEALDSFGKSRYKFLSIQPQPKLYQANY